MDDPAAVVGEQRAAGPRGIARLGVARLAVARRAGPLALRPARLHGRLLDPLQRHGDGRPEAEQPLRRIGHVLGDVVLPADDLGAERTDERPGQRVRNGRDQTDPVAGQTRSEERHPDDDPAAQAGHGGEALHHVAVGDDVRAADVEAPVDLGRQRRTADQVVQHVLHRDRLQPCVHPPRGDHHRQPLGEVAQHLERRRSAAENDRRAQHRRRHTGVQENLPDLGPRRQVLGDLAVRPVGRGGPVVGQPAEVDDAAHPAGLRRGGEVRGGTAILGREVPPAGEGVDQVVGDVDALEHGRQGGSVEDVGGRDLDLGRPRDVAQPSLGAGQRAHAEARGQQFGHKPPADVAGGSGDQCPHVRLYSLVARSRAASSVVRLPTLVPSVKPAS